jgi:hypothetical protein
MNNASGNFKIQLKAESEKPTVLYLLLALAFALLAAVIYFSKVVGVI